ncbi:MAG: 1-acyl-sn-glycerol-3-phosphate acyltransferase [Candidatus Hydrothermae bacterium]|nr:1-acyl-sn-glycerol-3-phosphate acyltransferase [Candidatus Hydrothermae bacterium]
MSWRWRLAVWVLRPVFRGLFGYRAYGVHHLPSRGAVLLASNHYTNLDPVLVALPMNRDTWFFASEGLFHHPRWGAFLRWLITTYHAIPVDPRRPLTSLKRARILLSQGKPMVIFPEGERNFTAEVLLPFQEGTALLSAWTGVPVVPVYIHRGVQQGWRAWMFRRAPLRVYYGPPLSPPASTERKVLQAWTQMLDQEVRRLAEEALASTRG